MKLTMNFLFIAVLFVGTAQLASAQAVGQPGDASTGIATMFARDPLTQSVCFKDGGPGGIFQAGQTRNRCSDLNFNSYKANAFSVGIEGGREGVIVDLGTPEELKAKYGFQETVGNGQGFASIDVKNGKALILKDYKAGNKQELSGTTALFATPTDAAASAQVKLGHIYLLRIVDRNNAGLDLFAKVLVVAHVPGESVTIRWQTITSNETAKVLKP